MKLSHKPTPNVYELDGVPVAIVLHTTLGSIEGAVEWLRTTPEERERQTGVKSYSSAHAVIGRYGEVVELAGVDKGTWHAGAVSKPSKRALDIIPKTLLGQIKNPNKHTIGLEFASGYDIDKDGVLESWEKLYTKSQIKGAVEYVLTRIEPEILAKHGVTIEFADANVITHRDVTSYKPDLEIQRAMFLAELKKQREEMQEVTPAPITETTIKKGQTLKVAEVGEGFIKLTT